MKSRIAATLLSVIFALMLTSTTSAQQPENKIDDIPGVSGIAASYNLDDGNFVVLVGLRNGKLDEIFYKVPTSGPDAPPAQHGRSTIGRFNGIRFVAGFYAQDDHNRIAIVATKNGDIHEIFYHPDKGRGESVIAHFDDIVGLAGFYNIDDKNRVVLVATGNGQVHEIFYNSKTGKGEHVLATYPAIRTISGHFDQLSKYRVLLAVTQDGALHGFLYRPGYNQRTFNMQYPTGSRGNQIISLSSNTWTTTIVTNDGLLQRCTNNFRDGGNGVGCWSSYNIDHIRSAAMSPDGPDGHYNIVYTTDDRRINASNLGGPARLITSNEVLHKFVPAAPVLPPPAPKITLFKATPTDYISIGSSTSLVWNISNCSSECAIVLEAHNGLGYSNLEFKWNGLPVSGNRQVTPTQTNTRYTLTATGSGYDSKSVDVAWAQGQQCTNCSFYYFRMTSATSVTPCFTLAIYAKDASTAKAMAESQNGGFTATAISQQEYLNGCN
jgi:hypothetical protein